MRSVICPEIWHSESLDSSTGEFALSMNHPYLFRQGHTLQGIVYPFFDFLRFVEINRLLCAQWQCQQKCE